MKRVMAGVAAVLLIAGCSKNGGESIVQVALEAGPAPVYVPNAPAVAPTAPAPAAVTEATAADVAPAEPAGLEASAQAAAGPELAMAQKYGCFGCHDISNKKVGPSWKVVSAHYKGQVDAKTKLVASVKNGSKGKWAEAAGAPMPPHAGSVPDADIDQLVGFILKL